MGQYYKIVNLDRKEYLKPWTFGSGAKLMEICINAHGALVALALLLAHGNGEGLGDVRLKEEDDPVADLIGSWKGDRIVITGDYAQAGELEDKLPKQLRKDLLNKHVADFSLYDQCDDFKDISEDMKRLIELSGLAPFMD